MRADTISEGQYQYQNRIKQSGWLEKKSPAVLKGWQRRYFMIVDNNGHKIVYFQNEKTNTKPKGAFNLSTFVDIEQQGTTEFTIKFPERNLQLRAKSESEKMKWVETLLFCKMSTSTEETKRYLSVDQISGEKRKVSDHKKVDVTTTQIVQIEKEKIQKQASSRDLPKKSILQITLLNDEQMLEATNLSKIITGKMFKLRVIYGYLEKRSNSKIKHFRQYWFFLISSKSLFPEIADDEQILLQSQINLELDTLIYYKQKGIDNTWIKKTQLRLIDCKEIIIKNMQKSSDQGFTFKLNVGDKIFSFKANSENERIKWQSALNQSIITSKEINNSLQIQILKNINPIIKLYDSEQSLINRRQKIKEKLLLDIQQIELEQNMNQFNKFNNMIDFLQLLTLLQQDMIKSMEACQVKEPQRLDIIKEYIDVYHERICEMVTEIWNEKHASMEQLQIIQLASWLTVYQQLTKRFIQDERITQGIKQLLQIYLFRWRKTTEDILQKQISLFSLSTWNGNTITCSCQSLLHQIEEIESILDPQFITILKNLDILKSIKQILWLYFEFILNALEQENDNLEYLYGVCNDIEIIELLSDKIESANTLLQIKQIEKPETLRQKILDKYNVILNLAETLIYYKTLSELQIHFQVSLLELELHPSIQYQLFLVLYLYEDNIPYQTLQSEVQKRLIDRFIQNISFHYFNTFLTHLTKLNSYKKKQLEAKVKSDLQQIQQFLKKHHSAELPNKLDSFNLIIQLLFCEKDSNYILIFQGLKQQFGRSFTKNTVKIIMANLGSIQSETLSESRIQDQCDELLKSMDELLDQSESTQDINSELHEFGQNQPDELTLVKQSSNSSRTSKTSMSKSKVSIEELISKSQVVQSESTGLYEGYLYKKKAKQSSGGFKKMVSKWDHRYIRIRKGYIYWYLDEKSKKSQNKISISQIQELQPKPNKLNKFTITVQGDKQYEFRVEREEERDQWILAIRKEQQQLNQTNKIEAQLSGVGMGVLIKNYDESEMQSVKQQSIIEMKRKTTFYALKQDCPLELGNTSIKAKQSTTCWSSLMACFGLVKF